MKFWPLALSSTVAILLTVTPIRAEESWHRNCPPGGCGQLWKGVSTCSQARQACLAECAVGDCLQKCGHKYRLCMSNGGTWVQRPGGGTPGMKGLKPN